MKLKPNAQRANYAELLMKITLVTSVVVLLLDIYQSKVLTDINSGEIVALEFYDRVDMIFLIGSWVNIVAMIVCAVYFIMWFRRAYFNLHVLSSGLKYSEGWAAGAWFIPIFYWFGPYHIATDLFSKTENMLAEKGIIEKDKTKHTVKGSWWACWITGLILGNISSKMNGEIDMLIARSWVAVISDVFTIGAAIFGIKMIRSYHEMERRLPELDSSISTVVVGNSDLLDEGF